MKNNIDSVTCMFLVREYFRRLINEKDLSVCDEMLSEDYKDSDASPGVIGPNATKEYVKKMLEEYPDMHVEIKDILSKENKVAARIEWYYSNRATGEKNSQMGIVILHFNNNYQIIERWSAYK